MEDDGVMAYKGKTVSKLTDQLTAIIGSPTCHYLIYYTQFASYFRIEIKLHHSLVYFDILFRTNKFRLTTLLRRAISQLIKIYANY